MAKDNNIIYKKICLEHFKSRVPILLPYIGKQESDSNKGSWGKIPYDLNLETIVGLENLKKFLSEQHYGAIKLKYSTSQDGKIESVIPEWYEDLLNLSEEEKEKRRPISYVLKLEKPRLRYRNLMLWYYRMIQIIQKATIFEYSQNNANVSNWDGKWVYADYFNVLLPKIVPYLSTNGGPVIMMQVENEYGSYGEDKPYVSAIRDCLRGIYGKDLALFQCDWSSNFTRNGLDDLVWTMNFGTGSHIDNQFRHLKQLRPDSPLMCSEFWSGWFDKWGARHETRPAKDMVAGLDEMLSKGISFSLYMTHGGTSFGHWAGANSPGFQPDVTSYDYDAPINEYGHATPKYHELRNMMQKYTDKKLPSVPKPVAPIITVPEFKLTEFAPLANGAEKTVNSKDTKTFEDLDMGWGTAVYTVDLPETKNGGTLVADVHDFAQYFINGKYVGKTDRVKNERALTIPATKKGDKLQIVVEGMGRINFGRAIKDFKGIVGDMKLTAEENGHEVTWNLKNWSMTTIPDDYQTAVKAFEKKSDNMGTRGYYRGYFNLKKVGDTFLNFETWGKGQVYVNGHAMGRIWYIGPQQTLFIPGCWLKKGKNEIIVLDVVGPKEAKVWGQDTHEVNKLQLEKSNKHNNIGDKPDLNSATPAATGAFKPGNGWQTVKFSAPQKGRYLAIECLSTQDGKPQVAIAELYLQGTDGKRISREPWTTKYANSEEENGNHMGDKVFDLQESTYWMTEKSASMPHLLVIDLGSVQTISALEYCPRAEQGAPGSIKNYKIYMY
jgi:beta-galactosidase